MQKKVFDFYIKNRKFINNWDLVDTSAPYIVGPYVKNRSRKILHTLAKSKSLWDKRIAVLSTFAFIKEKDFADALSISEILLQDKHDLIQKAVGWMLREVGNKSIETEEKFLEAHAASMPRTMLRYAIEKFPPQKKARYMAMKKSA
jgi:3-methyladenine DNA glycosylase AlkD